MPVTALVSFSVERVEVLDPEGQRRRDPDAGSHRRPRTELHRWMVLTRRFDERMLKLQRQGRLGTFARVTGQEAAQLGAAFALHRPGLDGARVPRGGHLLDAGHAHGAVPPVLGRGRAGQRHTGRRAHAAHRDTGGHPHAARGGIGVGHQTPRRIGRRADQLRRGRHLGGRFQRGHELRRGLPGAGRVPVPEQPVGHLGALPPPDGGLARWLRRRWHTACPASRWTATMSSPSIAW